MAALITLIGVGVWCRYQFIILLGGLEPSYLEWALEHYFGGISGTYLGGAETILSLRPFPTLGYPPGYPAFLAILQAVGFRDMFDLRVAQASIEVTLGVIATYRILRFAEAARPWAVTGAGFYAIYPPLAASGGLLLAEGLSPALFLLCLNGAAWVSRAPGLRRLSVFGFGLGVVSLIRPDLVLIGGPLAVWLWWFGGVALRPQTVAALALSFVAALMPWGVHNRVVHGAWVLTSTGGSAGLWEGLGILENPYGYVLNDNKTIEMLREKGYTWHSVEADRYLRQDYLRAWREHPEFVLRAAAYRWDQILWQSEYFQPPMFRRLQGVLDNYGPWFVLAAAAVGFRQRGTWLILLPVPYALLSIGMVHYEPRYVRYVHLAYFLAAGVAMDRVLARVRPMPHLSATAGVVAAVWCVYQATWQVPILKSSVERARFTALLGQPNRPAMSAVEPRSESWQLLPEASHRHDGEADAFLSPPVTTHYIATRDFAVPSGAMLVLAYDVTTTRGNLTVGLLDAGQRWMQTTNLPEGGRHRGSVIADVETGLQVSVVFAGANSAPTVTDFIVHSLVLSTAAR